MRNNARLALLLVALAGACGDDAPTNPMTTPDAGAAGVPLRDWVTSMTDVTRDDAVPDTVEDKVVVDTDDPAAFDAFLGDG